MKELLASLLYCIIALFAFPALAAGPAAMTWYKGGAISVVKASAKATRVEAEYCLGTAFWATTAPNDVPTTGNGTRIYFATPASCVDNHMGIAFHGMFERIDFLGSIQGLSVFEGTPSQGELIVGAGATDARVGSMVFVYDDQEMKVVIGKDTVIAAPGGNTFLSAYIAGEVGYANRRIVGNCGPSGCGGVQEDLGYGYAVLDKGFSVPPGTAVLDDSGQTVGMIIGADKGKTLIARTYAVLGVFQRLGIIGDGKG